MTTQDELLELWRNKIDNKINFSIKSSNPFLNQILNKHIISGGKRIRGLFTVFSCILGDFNEEKALKAAAAIEILHTATLLHDDVIDRAKTRRGKETINSLYGSDMAIYAGDFLFTKSIFLLAGLIPENNLEILARGIKSMCEGEVIQYNERYNAELTQLKYFRIISKKTALLFAKSCLLGAEVGKLNLKNKVKIGRFGYNFGMAFQIQDDLKDLLSDELVEGKPRFSDIKSGILTLPMIYGAEQNNNLKDYLTNPKYMELGIRDDEYCLKVRDEILATDAIQKTKEVINKYKLRMKKLLDEMPRKYNKEIFEFFMSKISDYH